MSDVTPGAVFGPYRVIAPLGKGGMGEVYVASDDRLGRRVALKLLPESVAGDAGRRARFVAEARAASALHHPNIVTIFDIGNDGGRDYFAMELVDGLSLRSSMAKRPLPRERALTIAADVAAALAAAHASGIVHRDIKPENIVVMPSGQAKVLDYGLAKLTDSSLSSSPDSPTLMKSSSVAGSITGTIAYMSPEQASGEAIDSRTDIFSLGVVMYEMLTGRHPFAAKTPIEQLHKIINSDPPPICEVDPSIEPALADIVEKALARDRDWRYASAADLRIDLLRAQRAPVREGARVAATAPRRAWMAAAATLALIAVIALLVFRPKTQVQTAVIQTADVRLTPLTTDGGYAGEPSFAPDGTTLAYVSDRNGNFEIYLKRISGGPDLNLTNSPVDDVQPAFSPDGKEIAFVSSRGSRTPLVYPNARAPLVGGGIWVMPAFGGMPRRVVERGNFPTWTADGKSLLFSAGPWNGQKIYRVPAFGGPAEEIPIRSNDSSPFLFKPQQSPDGKWIVFATQQENILVVPAAGGEAKVVARGWEPVWIAGNRVLFSRSDRNESLWAVTIDAATGGGLRTLPVTVGRGRDAQPAISRDGRTIAFTAQQLQFNIERVRFDPDEGKLDGEPEVLTRGPGMKAFFDVSRDQQSIVYQQRENNMTYLWRADAGKQPVRLTGDDREAENYPVWSPDGTEIAFLRNRTDGSDPGDIWVVRADGSAPRMILKGAVGLINWTFDGRGISYHSAAGRQVHIVELATRKSRPLTSDPNIRSGHRSTFDGQWLLYATNGVDGSADVNAVQTSGGPSRVVFATPNDDFHPFPSLSGRWIYAFRDHKNLIRVPGPAQDWRAAPPEQVTFFNESNLMLEDGQGSADGKWLYYSRRTTTSDIWLMTRTDGSAF